MNISQRILTSAVQLPHVNSLLSFDWTVVDSFSDALSYIVHLQAEYRYLIDNTSTYLTLLFFNNIVLLSFTAKVNMFIHIIIKLELTKYRCNIKINKLMRKNAGKKKRIAIRLFQLGNKHFCWFVIKKIKIKITFNSFVNRCD